jgi:hypothetical protein
VGRTVLVAFCTLMVFTLRGSDFSLKSLVDMFVLIILLLLIDRFFHVNPNLDLAVFWSTIGILRAMAFFISAVFRDFTSEAVPIT